MMEVERMTLNVVIPVLNEEKALRAGVEGDGPVPGWDGGRGRVHHHDRGQRIHGRHRADRRGAVRGVWAGILSQAGRAGRGAGLPGSHKA